MGKSKINYKCNYLYDPECDYGVDLNCCNTCTREKTRTCSTGIYDDIMITFQLRGEDENTAN